MVLNVHPLLRAESACGILPGLELRRWLNWIEHLTTDQEVTGSSPVRRAIYHSPERVYEPGIYDDFRFGFYWSATGPIENFPAGLEFWPGHRLKIE